MTLKKYLDRVIRAKIAELTEEKKLKIASLENLSDVDTKKADYMVHIVSLWAKEGEESTITKYTGTLRQAIQNAEDEFRATNRRKDIQADYRVAICIGIESYNIPEEYWKDFKQDH
jgi:predicted HNH restriction endonuclease